MRIVLPPGLEDFAREFSRYKTPATRTQGWSELPHETRGEGDLLDTIGSLMLWRYLVSENIPTTYLLTGRQGDEADIRVQAGARSLNINVKTSKFQPSDDDPCRNNHIAVKEIEFSKPLPDLFVQVFVHLPQGESSSGHVHICNWISCGSDAFRSQSMATIPNTGGSKGYWIGRKSLRPIEDLLGFIRDFSRRGPQD